MIILPGLSPLATMFNSSAGGGSGPVTTIALLSSHSYNAATFAVPGTVQEGDLMALLDNPLWVASTVDGDDTPTNWTRVVGTFGNNGYGIRLNLSIKIAGPSDAGSNVTGGNGSSWDRKALAIFRADAPISSFYIGNPLSAFTGSQTNKTVTTAAGSGSAPMIVFGAWYSDNDVNPRTMTPTKTGEQNIGDNYAFLGWKIYNLGDTPANVTVALSEAGADLNTTMAAFIEVT